MVSKKSSSVSFSAWPRTNCCKRRIEPGNRDLGELRALVEDNSVGLYWTSMISGCRPVIPFDQERGFGNLFHRCLVLFFLLVADTAGDAPFGAHALAVRLLIVHRLQDDAHDLLHRLRG